MYILVDKNNRVVAYSNIQGREYSPYDGDIPTPTETQHLEYVNGRVIAVDNVSNEELRRRAYETEVDPLVTRYVSYFAEMEYAEYMAMENDEASDAYKAYLAQRDKFRGIIDGIFAEIARKKTAIRALYPDEVSE